MKTNKSKLEKQSEQLDWIEKDRLAGIKLNEMRALEVDNSILNEVSSKVLRQLIIEGINIGLNYPQEQQYNIHSVGSHVKNVGKEELTCIDCIYCEKDKNVNSGFICDKNGCEIDNPNEDYCDTYFVWR